MTEQMAKALDLLEHCHKTRNCKLCGFYDRGICLINAPLDWGIELKEYVKHPDGWHRREEATHDI